MDNYLGPDRRRIMPCPMHDSVIAEFVRGEKRMDRVEEKIDVIISQQSKQDLVIQQLKDAIGNGLRSDIRRTVELVEDLSKSMKQRYDEYDEQFATTDKKFTEVTATIKELNDFKWFREMANNFRNNLVKNVLAVMLVGGGVFGVIVIALIIVIKYEFVKG